MEGLFRRRHSADWPDAQRRRAVPLKHSTQPDLSATALVAQAVAEAFPFPVRDREWICVGVGDRLNAIS